MPSWLSGDSTAFVKGFQTRILNKAVYKHREFESLTRHQIMSKQDQMLADNQHMIFAMIERRGLTAFIPREWKPDYALFLNKSTKYKEHIRKLARERT